VAAVAAGRSAAPTVPSSTASPTSTVSPTPTAETTAAEFRIVLVDTATDTTRRLVTADDVASAGEVRSERGYAVPVSLTGATTTRFTEAFRSAAVVADPDTHEIGLVVDGEDHSTYGVAPELARAVQSGDWDGEILLRFDDQATAE
jgi:hypothetical protein